MSTSSGSGTGARFDVVVGSTNSNSNLTVTCVVAGQGYAENETITISNSSSSDSTTSGITYTVSSSDLVYQLDGLEIVEYDSINSRSHIVVYENDDDNNETKSSRIMIKNQTTLIQNGIYYISSVDSSFLKTSGSITLTRTSDFDSVYDSSTNADGDIRPGDYAFILDGIHESNKNHAFVMTNEHITSFLVGFI